LPLNWISSESPWPTSRKWMVRSFVVADAMPIIMADKIAN